MRSMVALLVAAIIAGSGCVGSDTPSGPNSLDSTDFGTIAGSIKDNSTYREGLLIQVKGSDLSDITDERGTFAINRVPTGEHWVTVTDEPWVIEEVLVVVAKGQTTMVTLEVPWKDDGQTRAVEPRLACRGSIVHEPSPTSGTDAEFYDMSWAVLKSGFRVAVAWTTPTPEPAWMEYSVNDGEPQLFLEPEATRLHLFIFDGLPTGGTFCFSAYRFNDQGLNPGSGQHAVRLTNAMNRYNSGVGAYDANLLVLAHDSIPTDAMQSEFDGYAGRLNDLSDGNLLSAMNIIVQGEPAQQGSGNVACSAIIMTAPPPDGSDPACYQFFDVIYGPEAPPQRSIDASGGTVPVASEFGAIYMQSAYPALSSADEQVGGQLSPGPPGALLAHEASRYFFAAQDLAPDGGTACIVEEHDLSLMADPKLTELDGPANPCPVGQQTANGDAYISSWSRLQHYFPRTPERFGPPDVGPAGPGDSYVLNSYSGVVG